MSRFRIGFPLCFTDCAYDLVLVSATNEQMCSQFWIDAPNDEPIMLGLEDISGTGAARVLRWIRTDESLNIRSFRFYRRRSDGVFSPRFIPWFGQSDSAACVLASVAKEVPNNKPIILISAECRFSAGDHFHGTQLQKVSTSLNTKDNRASLLNKLEATRAPDVLALVLHEDDVDVSVTSTRRQP